MAVPVGLDAVGVTLVENDERAGTDHEGLTGHVIVCGLHDVGLRIVEQLHAAGERVVVVDDDPDQRRLRTLADWASRYLAASAQRAGHAEQRRARRARARWSASTPTTCATWRSPCWPAGCGPSCGSSSS